MKLPAPFSSLLYRPLPLSLLVLSVLALVLAQEYDYDDYPQQDYGGQHDYYGGAAGGGGYYQEEDTLYQDYAKHQEEKAMGAGG
jgi:hypothetical protein